MAGTQVELGPTGIDVDGSPPTPEYKPDAAERRSMVESDSLVARARDVAREAYVPYSEYPVGAALRTADGSVYVGCNIENANFSNSLHAEEVAVAEAVKAGHRSFDRLAVSSAARDGVTPCGMCRQTLAEFCDDDLRVVCDEGDGVTEYTLGELLPDTISPETLEAARAARDRDGGP
jgi:cytidine deaminase